LAFTEQRKDLICILQSPPPPIPDESHNTPTRSSYAAYYYPWLVVEDADFKYVNVRRLLVFMEQSIVGGLQWAVFEPNDPVLWTNVARTVQDFLLNLWKTGALVGTTAEGAFFVRCDRTTMTQEDLDPGRFVMIVGVAPIRPAEFVVLRFTGQTARKGH
jgi:phage tail sheath protein FI